MTTLIARKSFWYLIKTKIGQERRAKYHLERQNIEVFCPEVTVELIKRGKLCSALEILFPGYIFVRITESSSSVGAIRSTRGVVNFIYFGSSIAKVPLSLITELKAKTTVPHANVISKLPKKGDSLYVSKGTFKGINVIFSQLDGESRAMVLMNIMNQEVKASINFSDIWLPK